MSSNIKKNRCKFWNNPLYPKGCIHGEECKYLHENDAMVKQQTNKKINKVCTYFIKGACLKGSSCQYDHPPQKTDLDFPELKVSKTVTIAEVIVQFNSGKNIEFKQDMPCKYFTTYKGCQMGDKCQFIHDSSFIMNCVYEQYETGCTKNDCPFKHVKKQFTQQISE